MAQKKDKIKSKILVKLEDNWSWIAILIACSTAGFWFGRYYTETVFNVEKSKIENQNNLKIIEIEKGKLEQMKQFQDEIMNLKNDLMVCKRENNESHEKTK
ncbi:MAG: hypothetical protein LBU91_04725 [Bacteroidales bacterium]|jgi:hypothetical protein|nr:hypothetical protein [Bacteroidales bacterium]